MKQNATSVKSYTESNRGRFLEELFSLIRIPSISVKHENKPDILTCAQRRTEVLLFSGADKAEIIPAEGSPIVYTEKVVSLSAPIVLVYAHYNVMPAEPLELRKSESFEPVIRDGCIWARGTSDDKGRGMVQVKGFEIAIREGSL